MMMRKAEAFLRAAERDARDADWSRAASGAYYAVFHAMSAALASQDLAYSKHSGVIAFFRKHFIRTGILPEEFSEVITRLSEDREIGDYSYERSVNPSAAIKDVHDGLRVVAAIREHLLAQGFQLDAPSQET
jgi:uncharacterized protein (UPF0332 family)